MTSFIINDFTNNRRIDTILNPHTIVPPVWQHGDRILTDMQSNPFFAGRNRWCDLDPSHYRLMIIRNLTIVSEFSDTDRADLNNPAIKSLHFLLSALVYLLEMRTDTTIEFMKINRINDRSATFDYACSLNLYIDKPIEPANVLKIIVDNEKD